MERLLTHDDYQQAADLLDRRIKTSPEALEAWKLNIKNFFLTGEQFKLFGYFVNDKLVAMLGMRQIGPHGVVLSWAVSETEHNGLVNIIQCFSKFADENDINNIFYITSTKRVGQYLRYLENYLPEYYAKYETHIVCEIPAGERPKEDFFWGMMGRITLPHDASIVHRKRITPLTKPTDYGDSHGEAIF